MKEIEALLSGKAMAAAIVGGFPSDLGELAGTVTNLPAQIGRLALDRGVDILKTLQDLAEAPDSVIGAVVAAIKYIVNSLAKAASEREINFAEARCGYLAEACGVVHCADLRGYQGRSPGFWNYPRASVAKDRPLPIWDPIGTPGNIPTWLVPYGWAGDCEDVKLPIVGTVQRCAWPDTFARSMPKSCTDWAVVNLDAGDTDCPVKDAAGEYTIAWPWAYPLTCPGRIAGVITRSSKGPEDVIAGLYALPSPQHIRTRRADVAESERLLRLAMQRWFPLAYEAEPGAWRNPGQQTPTGPYSAVGGYVKGKTAPGVGFEVLASSLSRVNAWHRCRAAMLENPYLLPAELQELLPGNPDFSAGAGTVVAGTLKGGKAVVGLGAGTSSSGASSGGELAVAGLALWALLRG